MEFNFRGDKMQKSLLDLCISAIRKINDVNLTEILTNIADINPDFEKKIHYLLEKSILFESIGEQKKWYKSGELRIHKSYLSENTIQYTKFFKNGRIYQMYTKYNGKFVGEFIEFFANGKQRIYNFYEDNVKTKYILWQANGYKSRSWSKINNDGLHEEEIYHSNGIIASLEFVQKQRICAKRYGMQVYWDKDGVVNRMEKWKNGKLELNLIDLVKN